MDCWMRRLAKQHGVMSRRYPNEYLIVVFDIDDTILDLRHMILNVLTSFDRSHRTNYFRNLAIEGIEVGETEIHRMMAEALIPGPDRQKIMRWFEEHAWSSRVVSCAHRPFPGVLDIIRRLQLMRNTYVGLNTGRPEVIRKETLLSLNTIGKAHGVCFDNDLLFMSPYDWGERISESKVQGIRYFQERGYRVVGFVDNEPENLLAVGEFDQEEEILLLHADTVYSSNRRMIPDRAVSGTVYDISGLYHITGKDGLGEAA